MSKIKQLLTSLRIIILILFIIMSLVAIHPKFGVEGVAIRAVAKNSAAEAAGLKSPEPGTRPVSKERILFVNGIATNTVEEYFMATKDLQPDVPILIKTNKQVYTITTKPLYEIIDLNETEIILVNESYFDEQKNQTMIREIKKEVPKQEKKIIGTEPLGITVYEAPTNNLKKGLDIEGGTRVLLQPEENTTSEDMDMIIDNLKQRLNVYGLSDIVVAKVSDLSRNHYILVEIAGANEEEVKTLISQQGKFEAKIGNTTVFKGGQDIKYVCRTPQCAYAIDPRRGCGQSGNEHFCIFSFSITLSPEAAQKQADMTKNLAIVDQNGEQYLSEKLDLYLDDQLVDSLNIGADLKGRPVTDISISGSGTGQTRALAAQDSAAQMKRLQTILVTGSLPVKLKIVKSDSISPILGEQFLKNAILVGFVSIICVALVVFIRYRKLWVSIPMFFTMLIEVLLLLGFAALAGWNLDLAAIAGIVVATGTGVDDQIIIADETLFGKKREIYDWKTKLKKAFFIIMGAYFATSIAMVPLLFAGAGLVKGFAIVTIVGVSIGVFLTRPAYAKIIEIIYNK